MNSMRLNPGFQQAVAVIRAAANLRPSEATRVLFDHYRTSRAESQAAFVLALIGEVAVAHARAAAGCSNALDADVPREVL